MVDISGRDLKMVKQILKEHVPRCEVRAFGSRVTGEAKKFSDLDLVVFGKEKISRKIKVLLKEAFENSKLNFRVDVLDGHAISENFRKIIDSGYEVIQKQSPL